MRLLAVGLFLLAALSLGGCASLGGESADSAQAVPDIDYQPDPGLSPQQRFLKVLNLLEAGEAAAARMELALYLEVEPTSVAGQDLMRQIELPARDYFPKDYREVELASGQTLSTLSRHYLGSLYRFHALAKYNGIDKPGDIAVGQTLRIPLTNEASAVFAAQAGGAVAQRAEDLIGDANVEATSAATSAGTKVAAPAAAVPVGDADALHRKALNAFRAQNLDTAIVLWDEVLELDPDYESARLYRSQAVELRDKLSNLN